MTEEIEKEIIQDLETVDLVHQEIREETAGIDQEATKARDVKKEK
jgi:hypothetical protein